MLTDTIIRLIVIEESANDAEQILSSLRKARFPIRPQYIEDEEDLQSALSEQEWDLLITVPAVGDFVLQRICEMVEHSKQDIPVIVLCENVNDESLAKMLGEGAHKVIPGNSGSSLQIAVKRELANLEDRREKRRLEHLNLQLQQQNSVLLDTSRDAIAYVHDGMHIYANPSYREMFGYEDMEELAAMPILDLVAPDSHTNFKEFMREYMTDEKEEDRDIQLIGLRSNKKRFKLKLEVSQAIYENERCIQIIIRDQSDSSELERKLKEQDTITGLYNRQHFTNLLEKALTKAVETRTRSVLLYITLDNFEALREQVGVGSTDPLMVNIAKLLKKYKEALVARFAEAVFTVLLVGKDVEYARKLGDNFRKQVETEVSEVGDQSVAVTCSVGIAQVLAAASTPQNVLSDAHAACQEAMKAGGNRVEVYKAVVKDDSGKIDSTEVAKMIETAIEEKRLSLAFQPIVSLRGEVEELYDIYLRMVDSEGQQIPAGTLFSAAEKANLSIHLDKWVLKEAVNILCKRQEEQGKHTHFFIKLSDQAIKDETLLLYINKLIKASKLPPDLLIIEISESIAISQMKHAKAFVNTLAKMKCRTALEHFGMSLDPKTSLTHLGVDYVKIDSSYAKGLSSNTENQDKVKALVELAHSFEKITIAEAVEDANSLTILWQCGMDLAQGHYIQEPGDELDFDFAEE